MNYWMFIWNFLNYNYYNSYSHILYFSCDLANKLIPCTKYCVLFLAAGLCRWLFRYLKYVVIFVCYISLYLNSPFGIYQVQLYRYWFTKLLFILSREMLYKTLCRCFTSKSCIHHNMFLSDFRYILYLDKQEWILSCSSYLIYGILNHVHHNAM